MGTGAPSIQSLLELPLRGKFGDRFESWEMDRKIARFSKQAGFGEETIFNAEIQCMACFIKYQPLDGRIHCPQCGSVGAKILSGEEFYFESIELDHE